MGDFAQKTFFIDKYIKKIDEAIERVDKIEAKRLIKEIVGVYEPEIKDIGGHLETYSFAHHENPDLMGDLTILKAKLLNYKANLTSGLYEHLGRNGKGLQVSQNVNQSVTTNVEITLDSTVSVVNNLSAEILSDDDKDILNGKLAAISAASDKPTRWEKAKSALKWIAEKSIEVGTAALPYIVEALKK